jgi:hypothetical protein
MTRHRTVVPRTWTALPEGNLLFAFFGFLPQGLHLAERKVV